VYLFPLFLPYMFRALISLSSGVSQAVLYIQPFGSFGVYVAHLRVPVDWFVLVVSLYWCRGGSPVLVALHARATSIGEPPRHQYSETTTTNQFTGTRR